LTEQLRRVAAAAAARGDYLAAAGVLEQGNCFFEAAEARRAGGDAAGALADLTRLTPEEPSYRQACRLAIRLAAELDATSLQLENLLARFLRNAPQDKGESESLRTLAALYERHGFVENAHEVWQKLAAFSADDADALSHLQALDGPTLAELPDLPSLAAVAAIVAEKDDPIPAATDDEEVPFREGVVVGGRYRLEQRVGVGAASVVFRATDLDLHDALAVKVLTHAVFDPETDARLRRELMLSRQLVHPNVVRTYDMGRAHGFRYITMELLVGTRLADRLRQGPLPLAEGLSYLAQACAGLQAAHDLGIVHRDVKPSNCFVVQGGLLKIMDFGIAKLRDAPGLTTSGVIAGTPAYMAPEQAIDFRKVTAATDIYALGVVAFEMFTASLPFVHHDPLQVLMMHRDLAPPEPRTRNASLPEELERIILIALAKSPNERFGSCGEMGRRLEALRLGRR
jgi:eukaryotic-like serine/threonine-protein kinase